MLSLSTVAFIELLLMKKTEPLILASFGLLMIMLAAVLRWQGSTSRKGNQMPVSRGARVADSGPGFRHVAARESGRGFLTAQSSGQSLEGSVTMH